jgi:hypothetical protein
MDVTTTQGQGARDGLLARWGERINPLVIKEVRQGGRSRVFWACFWLMLLACFLIALAAWSSTADDNGLRPQGRDFFFSFFCCLGVVHFFIIPYSAYRSLVSEREDETWVLLLLTGLGPRRILRGKVVSFLVQAGLYASAAGPFLLLSYFLNGIDLPILLTVLALGGCWLVFLTVLAVCAATLAEGKMGRAVVHFALLGTLGVGLIYALVSAYALSQEGFRLFSRERALTVFAGCFLWMMLTCGWVLFETAAARLSLPTENYSRAPRLALGVQALGSALLLLVGWFFFEPRRGADVASVLGCLHLTGCGLMLATDADGQARTLRAATRPWSLLRPGAVRGFRLAVLLLLFWGLVCAGLHGFGHLGSLASSDYGYDERLPGVLAPPVFALLYLSLPLWVARLPVSDVFSSPGAVRLLFVLGVILGGVLPPIVAIFFGERGSHPLFNLFSPFVGLSGFLEGNSGMEGGQGVGLLLCVTLVAALSVFLADRALVERERRIHAA